MLKKIKDSKFTSLTNDIANNRALSVIPELRQLKAFNKGIAGLRFELSLSAFMSS